MNFRRAFLFTTISISLNIALWSDAYSDGREVDAAVEVLGAQHDVEYNYKVCRAGAGIYAYKYDYIEYIWELKNRPYLQLSDKIFRTLPVSRVNRIKQLWESNQHKVLSNTTRMGSDGKGKYCSQYFSQLGGGTIHNLSTQKQNLAPALGSIEDARILQRNIDMEVGCMKQGYNSDIKQFEGVKKGCSCQTALVVKKMSNQDIDKYITLASSQNPQAAVQFISGRINISELQACYGRVGLR